MSLFSLLFGNQPKKAEPVASVKKKITDGKEYVDWCLSSGSVSESNKTYLTPDNLEDGDQCSYLADYYAKYSKEMGGWELKVRIMSSQFQEIPETILGKPVVSLNECFASCKELRVAPKIPSTIKYMHNAFNNCTNLEEPPIIPDGVKDVSGAFWGCHNLTKKPVFPSSVANKKGVFGYCPQWNDLTPEEEDDE